MVKRVVVRNWLSHSAVGSLVPLVFNSPRLLTLLSPFLLPLALPWFLHLWLPLLFYPWPLLFYPLSRCFSQAAARWPFIRWPGTMEG